MTGHSRSCEPIGDSDGRRRLSERLERDEVRTVTDALAAGMNLSAERLSLSDDDARCGDARCDVVRLIRRLVGTSRGGAL